MSPYLKNEEINVNEIIRTANDQAHEMAMEMGIKGGYSAYIETHDAVFNFLFRKLLMPYTNETPAWVVRLASYFSADAEIDEVLEESANSPDPLNQADFVQLIVRFKRNSGGEVKKVETVKISL